MVRLTDDNLKEEMMQLHYIKKKKVYDGISDSDYDDSTCDSDNHNAIL